MWSKLFLSLVSFLILTVGNLVAQVPTLQWAQSFGGSGYDRIRASTLDVAGNVYSVGYFKDTADLDPSAGTFNVIPSSGASGGGAYIQKLDSQGNFVWAKTAISGQNNKFSQFSSVTVSPSGSIYVVGNFFGDSLDVDPDPANSFYLKRNLGGSNTFTSMLIKLDNQGNLLWAKSQTGILLHLVELDAYGHLYVAGQFDRWGDGNPDPAILDSIYPATTGEWSVIVEKLDTAGNFIWGKQIGGPKELAPKSLALSQSGEPLIAGHYRGVADFDPDTAVFHPIPALASGKQRGFLLHLDKNGKLKWANGLDGNAHSAYTDMAVNARGEIFLTGFHDSGTDFDPDTATAFPATPYSYDGYFNSKLDSSGNLMWARAYKNTITTPNLGLNRSDRSQLREAPDGGVYYAGTLRTSSLELEPSDPNGLTLTRWMNTHIPFLGKIDSTGNVEWAHLFEHSHQNITHGGVWPHALELSAQGELYMAGLYSTIFYADPRSSTNYLTSVGLWDAFVVKFDRCPPAKNQNLMLQGCEAIYNGKTYHGSTLIYDTIKSTQNCDSLIINVEILIDRQPVGVSYQNGIFNWNYIGSDRNDFQLAWYDCDLDSIISGETDTTFTPNKNGNYALVVSKNGCADTSACFAISDVGLPERNPLSHISVFPNPATDKIQVTHQNKDLVFDLTLFDVNGRKLKTVRNANGLDIGTLSKGIYLLEIRQGGFGTTRKILKK